MNISKFLIASLISVTCGHALAEGDPNGTGLYLEPGITYQMTESNVNYSSGLGNSSAINRGFGVVTRGGIHLYERFFVAADARYALLKYKDNANNFSVSATSWDISPVVGMQMADYGVRVYGGYILAGNLDADGVHGFDPKFEEATGWRVGAGLKVQQVSVNIEWQKIHYGKAQVTSASGGQPTTIRYNPEGIVASVTFPIEFR